jgi:hypothetical protein
MKAVGDRVNVSEKVLSMHYDSRSEEEKMEQRRYYLALFCLRIKTVSERLSVIFRQTNRDLDAVWRYGIAQTACLDVSKASQTAR